MLLVSQCGSRARKSRLGAVAWGPAALRCSSQQTGRTGLGLLLHGHGVGSRRPRRWCECQVLAVGSGLLVPEGGACSLSPHPSPPIFGLTATTGGLHCKPVPLTSPPKHARPPGACHLGAQGPDLQGGSRGQCALGLNWAGPLLCPWHVGRQWGWPWAGPWRPPPHLEGAFALGDPQQHMRAAPG